MTGAINKGNMALKLHLAAALVACGGVLLAAAKRAVAVGASALGVRALVKLGVSITKLDGNIALKLALEANGLDTSDCLHHGRLAVGDMANGTNINCGLATDHLGRKRSELVNLELAKILNPKAGLLSGVGHRVR